MIEAGLFDEELIALIKDVGWFWAVILFIAVWILCDKFDKPIDK